MRELQVLNNHPRLQINEDALAQCVNKLDSWSGCRIPDGELSLVFPDQEEMCRLHAEFLDDPTLTDVITFDGDPLLDFAGEIFISADQALIQAPEFSFSFSSELTLYLVHGWLHLGGFDDTNPKALKEMKDAEKAAMQFLGKELTEVVFTLS